MSSTAPQIRRLQTVAPRIAQAALQRARLTVVPRARRSRAPRVPFVTFVSVILLAGVLGLLLFNTSMQQASFRATALQKQATDLSAQQEALESADPGARQAGPGLRAGAEDGHGRPVPGRRDRSRHGQDHRRPGARVGRRQHPAAHARPHQAGRV
ncbi:hypothetical protein G5V59_06500 [Nocardioides sp. W3-2-3]|uniref:hypothetical protein n=1 Tax=Nocardioides convexus TaxID=2712224 RepID=UPI002418390A|nr:hypothetical protein [Nocardioides convexus]NGZ99991.1 hypothetical protein [Nocardioides convexus]